MSESFNLVTVDTERLKRFAVRVIAGLGFTTIWALLTGVSLTVVAFVISLISNQEWSGYLWPFLFIPVSFFVVSILWWVCFLVSLELLAEVGIEVKGKARILIVPIAVPLMLLVFILGFLASAGEAIKNRVVLTISLIIGTAIVAAITVALVS